MTRLAAAVNYAGSEEAIYYDRHDDPEFRRHDSDVPTRVRTII